MRRYRVITIVMGTLSLRIPKIKLLMKEDGLNTGNGQELDPLSTVQNSLLDNAL